MYSNVNNSVPISKYVSVNLATTYILCIHVHSMYTHVTGSCNSLRFLSDMYVHNYVICIHVLPGVS